MPSAQTKKKVIPKQKKWSSHAQTAFVVMGCSGSTLATGGVGSAWNGEERERRAERRVFDGAHVTSATAVAKTTTHGEFISADAVRVCVCV